VNKSKKILTQEITDWLTDELNSCTDPVIKAAFGGSRYKSTDYFYQADSLRLRSAGFQLLKTFFDCEPFIHDRSFYTGEILTLSHNMNAPFFINERKIVLFSHENIVMCKLAGSVASWLDNFN
jgi:hypothetical protein